MNAVHNSVGPWEVIGTYVHPLGVPEPGICRMLPVDRHPDGYLYHGEITQANARMVAAAPELFSLLEDAVTSFADSVEGGEADEWVKACRAVLAKCAGRVAGSNVQAGESIA